MNVTSPVILLLVCVTAGGCNCFKDFTHDPKARFEGVVGKCFSLRQDAFVIKYSNTDESKFIGETPYVLQPLGEGPDSDIPDSVQKWNSTPRDRLSILAKRIVGVVPAGTRVRIVQLEAEICESGGFIPFAMVLDGQYKGVHFSVADFLNDPFFPMYPVGRQWTPKQELLVSSEAEK